MTQRTRKYTVELVADVVDGKLRCSEDCPLFYVTEMHWSHEAKCALKFNYTDPLDKSFIIDPKTRVRVLNPGPDCPCSKEEA